MPKDRSGWTRYTYVSRHSSRRFRYAMSNRLSKLESKLWQRARQFRGHDEPRFRADMTEEILNEASGSEFGKLFIEHSDRLVWKCTHYLNAYSEELGPYCSGLRLSDGSYRPVRFLEIGVHHGGSLQLWRKFFGESASVWGIDVDPRCRAVDDPDIEVRIGSQNDRAFLESVVEEMGGVDIVLDDGSHVARDQRTSFQALFPMLSNGGVYAVEDLQTSYWRDTGGGYHRGGSFVEYSKGLVDDMHAWYHSRGDRQGMGAANIIPRIAFYDGIVFVRKTLRARPTVLRLGSESF